MTAFNAGRKARGFTGRIKVSSKERNAGLTDKEANDSVGARPGRYNGRSRDRASF
jgi:hypothetical protein